MIKLIFECLIAEERQIDFILGIVSGLHLIKILRFNYIIQSMSYNTLSIKKILSSDLLIIFVIIFSIVSFQYLWILSAGILFQDINTPSVSPVTRARWPDSDGDGLPDVIEGTEEQPCERGEVIPFPENYIPRAQEGTTLGTCTGTDAFDKDTDNDGFRDNVEDSLGSDPNFWLDPGFIWIFWIVAIAWFIYLRVTDRPSLKEYEKFEELTQSKGVSSKSGKFAYGGGESSIFTKRTKDLSDEERKEMIEQDPRYQRMMGEEPEKPQISRMDRFKVFMKRNWWKLLLSVGLALFIRWLLFQV